MAFAHFLNKRNLVGYEVDIVGHCVVEESVLKYLRETEENAAAACAAAPSPSWNGSHGFTFVKWWLGC